MHPETIIQDGITALPEHECKYKRASANMCDDADDDDGNDDDDDDDDDDDAAAGDDSTRADAPA